MTEEHDDVIEQLASHNPAPREHYETLGRTPRAQALLEQITAHGHLRPRWWRRPRVVVPVALAVAAGATTATYQATRPPASSTEITCYVSTALTGSRRVVNEVAAGPVAACAAAWRTGAVGDGGPVPSLVACTFSTGLIGVFPGSSESVCTSLGLRPAERLTSLERREARLDDELSHLVQHAGCLGLSAGAAKAREELRMLDLEGWKVELVGGGSHGARHCATYEVVSAARTVDVVPFAQP